MSESPTPPQRVFLHVGLYKTGTTFLQNLLRQNRRRLARKNGLYVPPGPRKNVFASLDLIPRHSGLARDVRVAGAWDRLAAEVNGCGLPTAVVSEERLSVANARQARRAVASFPESEVHVVVTVRDLARVAVSHWQEEIKNGGTWTLDDYIAILRDPESAGVTPARGFWLHEDVTGVLRTWAGVVPSERVHVVTVPPPGSAPELLTTRFGSLLGFGPEDVPRQDFWNNENMGAAGAELLRRLNERLDGRLEGTAYDRGVKRPIVRRLAALPNRTKLALDDEQSAWAASVSAGYGDEIRRAGYPVVGDLDELVAGHGSIGPASGSQQRAGSGGSAPPADAQLLDLALEGLAELATRHGEAMAKADHDSAVQGREIAGRWSQMRTNVRSRGFAAARAAADLATRSRVGRRASAAYLRRRAGRA